MSSPTTAARPLTGWHFLGIICAFFGTIIAVNVVMATLAVGTFPGLVVENSYVASQEYNEMLDAARAQTGAGWRTGFRHEGGTLIFSIADRDGVPRTGLTVRALAGRPSTTQEDRSIVFAQEPGGYRADQALPAGLWEVDIAATDDATLVYRETKEVFIAPEGSN
jgi:nitrogen fixation protein FixH